MPIRFRCAFCHQLMAISRRKAGSVVRCPKCAGDIIVPAPDGAAPAAPNEPFPDLVFNDPNFDAVLDDGAAKPIAAVERVRREDPPSVPDIAQHRRGVFLPLRWLLALIVAVLLWSALIFGAGYFVGR